MLHLKNAEYTPQDTSKLLANARQLASGLDRIIRDCRVSTKYVEFDVSIDKSKINDLVEKLKPIAPLDHARHIVEEHIEKEDAIKMGINYFNEERFWESHEVFEGVWKNCYEGEKELVQGIILVAAALVHYQKAEDTICLSVLGRALEKLARTSGIYHNINVDALRHKVQQIRNSGQISLFTI
ncbi:MAG TPA: DUF309 domain-containing protein [Candidatus Nitrosotenuis sp.]|nr:DUF309 domain-containing protein [Candidatus Nitrosotenuis sp.]